MQVKKSELKKIIREEAYRLEYSEYMRNLDKLNRVVNEAILTEFIMAGIISQDSGFNLLREGSDRDLSTAIVPILREHALNEKIDWGALAKKTGSLAGKVGRGALKLGGRALRKGGQLAYSGAKAAAPHIGSALKKGAAATYRGAKAAAPHIGKGIKRGAQLAGRAAVSGYKGSKAMVGKAIQGTELMRMAKMDPQAFLELHRETESMIKGLSPDIRDARSAESFLGLLQTDAGIAMMDEITARTGMSSSEVERLIDNYVHQAEFVQTAVNSMESSRMRSTQMMPSPA